MVFRASRHPNFQPRCSTAFSQPEEAVALRVDRKYDLFYSKWTAVSATDFANSQIM